MIINSKYLDKYDIRVEQKSPILRCLLLLKNYTDRINEVDGNKLLLSNGYSDITIERGFLTDCFKETFPDPRIQCTGCLNEEFYSENPIFKHYYSFNGKNVVISLLKPVYSVENSRDLSIYSTKLLFLVEYYDKFNNDYLKNGSVDLNFIVYNHGSKNAFILPDSSYQYLVCEESIKLDRGSRLKYNDSHDYNFYYKTMPQYEIQAVAALRAAYEKTEELLGVKILGAPIEKNDNGKNVKIKNKRFNRSNSGT